MDLLWRSIVEDLTGNYLGYTTHHNIMKKYVGRIANFTEDADDCIAITTADRFERIDGKFNFLFTMWETNQLPPQIYDNLWKADHLIVPCKHNQILFSEYTKRPIHVCPEGVDSDAFVYKERKSPLKKNKVCRFLHVGAANPRKGFPVILEAWKKWQHRDDVELYMKTTLLEEKYSKSPLGEMLKSAQEEPQKFGSIIFDARRLPFDELIELYHSAHVGLYPSMGEGWGLPAIESMSTGLPIIAPIHTGHAEFMTPELICEVPFEPFKTTIGMYDDFETMAFIVNPQDLINAMFVVLADYDTAQEKAAKAAEHVRENFRWEMAAERLIEIIKENGSYVRRRN